MFYEKFLKLCRKYGLSPTAAAEAAGISRATVSNWKTKYEAGQDLSPDKSIIDKLCARYGCNEAWLRGIDEIDNDDVLVLPEKDAVKFALFGGVDGITDEMYDEVLQFAQFVKAKHKK